MKIAIIGYSGCGKSSLARHLGEAYNCAILHLDSVHWLPGWKERERKDEAAIVEQFMDCHTDWVIDGNYAGLSYERRMEEADRIIFMNFNRFACFYRAAKRYFKYRGRSREDMGEGCLEKMDFTFMRWILHDGRTSRYQQRYRNVLEKYGNKTVVIQNQKQLTRYIQNAVVG